MKRTITFLASLLVFSMLGFSQNIDVEELVVNLNEDSGIEYNEFLITNNTGSSIVLGATLEPLINCGGQTVSICMGSLCYPPTDEAAVYDNEAVLETVANGATTGLFAFHHIGGDEHQSSWKVCFFDVNNPSNETCITVNVDGEICIVSVAELSTSNEIGIGNIYPNPTTDVLSFDYENSISETHYYVFDLTGKTMLSGNVLSGNGTQDIDTTDLDSGVYFISINQSGIISRTQRFYVER